MRLEEERRLLRRRWERHRDRVGEGASRRRAADDPDPPRPAREEQRLREGV